MVPRDRAIVRRIEEIQKVRTRKAVGLVSRRNRVVKLDRWNVIANGVVDAANHAAIEGDAHDARQKALRDAVRHVDTVGLAPFRDDISLVHDDAGGLATILDRPDSIAEWLAPEGLVVIELEIARRLRLCTHCEGDRIPEASIVEA